MAPRVIPFVFPGIPGVRCAFSTREGGASAGPFASGNISFDVGDDAETVAGNRAALAASLGLGAWTECRQVHGDVTVFDPEFDALDAPGTVAADGLATTERGRGLVIKTADCQPVLVAHAGGEHVLALHVGWRGNRIGFIPTAIKQFCSRYGLDAKDLRAVRGPSLGPAAAEFVNFDLEWGQAWRLWFDETARTLDLWALTRAQLLASGLPSSGIHGIDLCTACLPELFFSYRREKTTGRMASVIWRE